MKRVPPSPRLLNTHPPPAAAHHISHPHRLAPPDMNTQCKACRALVPMQVSSALVQLGVELQQVICRTPSADGLSWCRRVVSPHHHHHLFLSFYERTIKLKPPCYLKKNCWLFLKILFFLGIEYIQHCSIYSYFFIQKVSHNYC